MVGGTLQDIRVAIQSLSCPDGDFEVVCGRSGIAPSAVAGLSFPDRHTAGEAAELAGTYRSTLRRYDPAIPFDDPLVHEVSPTPVQPLATTPEDRHTRFTFFCHDISGAVFEALSTLGHRDVESAAMETYLTLAEIVGDQSDFCLTMVWSLMSEMDVRLSADKQTEVVERAARLFPRFRTPNPVGATLRHLESVGFIDGYSARPVLSDDGTETDDERRCWEFTFGGYALEERTGRIPTLPIAIELLRRVPDRSIRFIDGEALADSRWRLRVHICQAGGSDGLVTVDVAETRWLNDTGLSLRHE